MTTPRKKKAPKRKTTKLDFTAPKGKVKLHLFVSVGEHGSSVMTYEKGDGSRVKTVEGAIDRADGGAIYHVVLVLAKPKAPKAAKVKAKAKDVTPAAKAEPTLSAPGPWAGAQS